MKKQILYLSIIFSLLTTASLQAQSWIELGTGSNALPTSFNFITAIVSDSNQNVYATGTFKNSNSEFYVAKWDGTSWSEVGSLHANSSIYSLCIDKNNNLYAAGDFTNSNSDSYVAKWDGTSWTEVGGSGATSLQANANINSVVVDAAGNVYAGGYFTNVGAGEHYVAKWDGSNWSQLGNFGTTLNLGGKIQVMHFDKDFNLYVAGDLENGSGKNVFKFDGTNWSELGASSNDLLSNGTITSFGVTPNGKVYVDNGQQNAGQYYIAEFDGTNWNYLYTGSPLESSVHVDANGNVYASNFYSAGKYNISKLTGTTWTQLGALDGNSLTVAMTSDKKGNLFAAGAFSDANSNSYVAKYAAAGTTPIITGNYLDNNIKVYPNPAQDVVSVDIDATLIGTSYSVYDYTTAKPISSGILSDLHTAIDLTPLTQGLYLVQLGDQSKNAFKIMKK